jgi:hypothetical protein
MDEKETFEYLKAFEFKEKFIVDYLNFLNDLREVLEMKKLKLNQKSELREIVEQNKKKEDNFNQCLYRIKNNSLKQECFYKLKILISEEESVQLDSFIKSQIDIDQIVREFAHLIEIINKNIEVITNKIDIGRRILEFVERLEDETTKRDLIINL